MTERMIPANGVELCAETFGDPADPALLLMAGASMSMDWWDAGFCERLAGGGRFVIRYDSRDTGRSTTSPPGAPGYTGRDLLEDAVALLDGLGVGAAHVVALSSGAGVAQELAVAYPSRLLSLTLLSTSPALPGDGDRPALPPAAGAVRGYFEDPPPEPDWTDRAAVVEYAVAGERAFAGALGVDEAWVREVAGRAFDRARDPAAAQNHWQLREGEPVRGTLRDIAAPTLVVHGSHDPAFPLPHGEALAREIPGARLLVIEGMGHQVPPPSTWDVVVPALLDHTR